LRVAARVTHLAAQRALVRMLFDPAFARAVREAPDEVLAHVAPPERAQLAALDDRALRLDRLRRLRALRTLADEFKGATTIALAERRALAFLEGFFGSTAFHAAVEERGSMPLAYAAFLAAAEVRTPLFADVLAIETALAHARRAPAAAEQRATLDDPRARVRLAAGVIALDVDGAAMAALAEAERYLFEVGLMPAVALCDDAPRFALRSRPTGARAYLFAVPLGAAASATGTATSTSGAAEREVSLVTVDAALFTVARCLPGARAIAAVLDEAAARGLPRDRARAALTELADGEIIVAV
jgi:hypothetical protein